MIKALPAWLNLGPAVKEGVHSWHSKFTLSWNGTVSVYGCRNQSARIRYLTRYAGFYEQPLNANHWSADALVMCAVKALKHSHGLIFHRGDSTRSLTDLPLWASNAPPLIQQRITLMAQRKQMRGKGVFDALPYACVDPGFPSVTRDP